MDAPAARCPCGSGETYRLCCQPLHRGERVAPTAEALMRSRYSAFALGEHGYLIATWHRSTRPVAVDSDGRRWLGLEVVSRSGGGLLDADGTVEFVARYRLSQQLGGQRGSQHETSRFVRVAGRWVYLGPA